MQDLGFSWKGLRKTEIRDETIKLLIFLAGKTSALNHPIIKCDIQ